MAALKKLRDEPEHIYMGTASDTSEVQDAKAAVEGFKRDFKAFGANRKSYKS